MSVHQGIKSRKSLTEGQGLGFGKRWDEEKGDEYQKCKRKPRKFRSPVRTKGKDFPEESTVNSVKAYKETKENEDRKRFWIFFFYDYPEGSWNITKAAEAEPKGIRIKWAGKVGSEEQKRHWKLGEGSAEQFFLMRRISMLKFKQNSPFTFSIF